MSSSARRIVTLGAVLFAVAVLQSVLGEKYAIAGARPDLLTATAIVAALFCDANGGAAAGFFAGMLLASLAAPPHGGFGSLIVSRTLTGFGVGWLEARIFRDNALLAVVLVALGTALAEVLFFLFAPQPNILHWLRAVGGTALYNGVLALPLYLLLRRLLSVRRAKETS